MGLPSIIKNGDTSQLKSGRLPRPAQLYMAGIQLAGLSLLIYAGTQLELNLQLLYLVVLTVVASLLSIQVVGSRPEQGSVTVSLGDFFVFAAMLVMGPAGAAVMGAVEGLVSSLRVGIGKVSKVLFNIAQLIVTAYLVGWLWQGIQAELTWAESGLSRIALPVAMVLCAMVYFCLNSLLVVVAIRLASAGSGREILRRGLWWALPTNCANASTVVLVLIVLEGSDPWLCLGLAPAVVFASLLRGASQRKESTLGLFSLEFLEDRMPERARGYLFALMVVAVPMLVYSLTVAWRSGPGWLYLAGLAALATLFPIRLFALKDRLWLSVSDLFVFVAILQYGPAIGVLVAAVEAVTFNLRCRPKRLYRSGFNLAQIVVTAFLVGYVLDLALSVASHASLILLLSGLMGIVYFAITSGLNAAAIAWSKNTSLAQIWSRNLAWFFPTALGATGGAFFFLLIS